jgi:PAS domain S-box-containing protein
MTRDRFQAVVEHCSDGILLVNAQGRITEVIHPTLGYDPDEMSGHSGFEVIHPDDIDAVRSVFRELLSSPGAVMTCEHRARHKDGSWHWLQSIGDNMLGDPAVQALVINYRDITEYKMLQQELLRRSEQLSRSNMELERFAYIASHDLQEPLRNVTTFLGLLERRHGTELGQDARELMTFVNGAASQMQDLIDDLLAFSRVKAADNEARELVDMDRAVREVCTSLKQRLEESGATITSDTLPAVDASPVAMQQLLQNLISNSIKYRQPEAPPHIHVSAKEETGEIVFSVADNGIGINPKYHDQIFIMFKRLHTRDIPGTGMGLAISKHIVERYRGRIWVESQLGQGATFRFALPVKR